MLRMKLSSKLVVCLIVIVVSAYYFMLTDNSTSHIQLETSTTNGIISTHGLVDAVVYISMGEGMSRSGMVDYSVASLRIIGKWNGDVYIITDAPDCFSGLSSKHQVKTVFTESLKDILHIKALKSRILTLLPESVSSILYIDVDIIVSRSLDIFLRDLRKMSITLVEKALRREEDKTAGRSSDTPSLRSALGSSLKSVVSSTDSNTNPASALAAANKKYDLSEVDVDFDFAAFPDAGGHYVGFCSGCEKWHTGLLWLKRGKGERCMEAWRNVLLSGRYDTDQESIDAAEAEGHCPHSLLLPSKHLLFAKDYIGMALTSGQTFIHATAAARLNTQDDFYKTFVLPRLHASLDPPLNPSILSAEKTCSVLVQTPLPTRAPVAAPAEGGRGRRQRGYWW